MKNILSLAIVLLVVQLSIAQTGKVGVNTTTPKATLEIKSQTANTTGDVEGILIPRVNKEKAYKMAIATTKPDESNMVYVDNATYTFPAGATDAQKATVADVTEKGYYFWNGTKWVSVSGSNGQEWKDGTNASGGNLIYANQAKTANNDVVILDSGNVGIGTDTPTAKLDVRGRLFLTNHGKDPAKPDQYNIGAISYKTNVGRLMLGNEALSSATPPNIGDPTLSLAAANYLPAGHPAEHFNGAFYVATNDGITNGMVNMLFMNKYGNVGIGTDKPSQRLEVNGVIKMSTGTDKVNSLLYVNDDPLPDYDRVIVLAGEGHTTTTEVDKTRIFIGPSRAGAYNRRGMIDLNASKVIVRKDLTVEGIITGTVTAPSDRRLKTNIQPVNSGVALVNKLNPVSYDWNAAVQENGGDDKNHIGFIAQEVEKVIPNIVYTDKKGNKSVNYTEVIPVLTKAIQEQQKEIEQLKAQNRKIEKLEALVKELIDQKK